MSSSAPVILKGSTSYIKTALAVGVWYTCATVLILLNKLLMVKDVRLPILLTFVHMLASYLWCELSIYLGWNRGQRLKFGTELRGIVVLSLTQGSSVLLVVLSFRYLQVSFEQALSASTPAFTALVGIFILGRQQKITVWLSLVPVVGGALLCFI